MLIIIEGCDGTGKTTFAATLGKFMRRPTVLHRGVPTRDPILEYTEDLHDYKPGGDKNVVCDRWHWGELIYGPLYRGESKLGEQGMAAVDLFLGQRGAVVAYLHQEPDVLRARFAERGEDYLQDEHVDWVVNAYEQVSWLSRLPVLRLTDPTLADALRVINVARVMEGNLSGKKQL